MNDLHKKTSTGLKWSAIERFLSQGIQLIIMLILGRILGPQAFGLIGMLAVFIAISQVFVDSGFSSALIRKHDRTESDYATVYYSNISIAIGCYIVLFSISPIIAKFYQLPELEKLIKYLALSVIFNSFSIVQRVKLTVEMNFKILAKTSLISILISSLFALVFAYQGYGVWALVLQLLSSSFLNNILLYLFYPWLPKDRFSRNSFTQLFGFGSKLLISGLIDTIYNNIYQLIIGKVFSVTQVGQFSQAKQLSYTPAMTLTAIIQRVTYPMMSHIQYDAEKLKYAYLMTLQLSAVLIFPIMLGMAIIAKPLIMIILGPSWTEAATLLSILCFGYLLYPIHSINLNLLQVKGRSGLFLKLEIVKKIIITIILCLTVPLGVKAICFGIVIESYIALIINTYYSGKLIELSMITQVRKLFPIWILAIGCAIISLQISDFFESDYIKIAIMFIFMSASYLFFIRIFFKEIYNKLKLFIR